MKVFKNFVPLYLLLIFSITGCVAGLQPPDAVTATSEVVLSLATPKATYTSKDAIPLELSIQSGKFDLLVPFVNVATSKAFAQLKITDTDGNIVEPKRSIPVPSSAEVFIEKDGRSVECIQGLELKAATTQVVSLEDLQKYYQLEKGSYTITLTIALPVYSDFLKKKHPEVIELEAEIKRIEDVTDAHVSAADKRSAVNDLQQQIEFLEKKNKDIYLPVKSLLGEASLTSNSVALRIE
ncbi:MAG: hypothetical protein OXU23_07245 [Candidatus Poribacteria bacterium]|nr:hypothetical protein [Candidatus Poribacteria bacterium]MDE0466871.1 hypothetical protein [Candidatus Poribacteria bacterium]